MGIEDHDAYELELRAKILKTLRDLGVDVGMVSLDIIKGKIARLRGEVYSENMRQSIRDAVIGIAGEGNIIDEIFVLDEMGPGGIGDDYIHDEDAMYGGRDDYIGTEDAYRAVEDGIPYIPPTEPMHRINEKRRRTKRHRDDI